MWWRAETVPNFVDHESEHGYKTRLFLDHPSSQRATHPCGRSPCADPRSMRARHSSQTKTARQFLSRYHRRRALAHRRERTERACKTLRTRPVAAWAWKFQSRHRVEKRPRDLKGRDRSALTRFGGDENMTRSWLPRSIPKSCWKNVT
jgi:hypothetical protein